MKAGPLRQWITFEAKTMPEAQSSFGETDEVWAPAFSVWAAFEPLGSREFPMADKRWSEATARFRIRYRGGIDPDKHRIVMIFDPNTSPVTSSTWNIAPPITKDGKMVEMWIEASEIK